MRRWRQQIALGLLAVVLCDPAARSTRPSTADSPLIKSVQPSPESPTVKALLAPEGTAMVADFLWAVTPGLPIVPALVSTVPAAVAAVDLGRPAPPLPPLPCFDPDAIKSLAEDCRYVNQDELREVLALTWKVCHEEGYPFLRTVAQIRAESDFRTKLVSSAGARGLMQLIPDTARYMGFEDVSSPEDNIRCGVRYMKYLERLLDNETPHDLWVAALACYNSGPGTYFDILRRTRERTGATAWDEVERTYARKFRKIRGTTLPETMVYIRRTMETLKRLNDGFIVVPPSPATPDPVSPRPAPSALQYLAD